MTGAGPEISGILHLTNFNFNFNDPTLVQRARAKETLAESTRRLIGNDATVGEIPADALAQGG